MLKRRTKFELLFSRRLNIYKYTKKIFFMLLVMTMLFTGCNKNDNIIETDIFSGSNPFEDMETPEDAVSIGAYHFGIVGEPNDLTYIYTGQ